jgi:hypothetical protein
MMVIKGVHYFRRFYSSSFDKLRMNGIRQASPEFIEGIGVRGFAFFRLR